MNNLKNDALFLRFTKTARSNGVILDTNVMLLYIVGLLGDDEIEKEERLGKFTLTNYIMLKQIVDSSKYRLPIVTPHIVTEIAYFLGNNPKRKKDGRVIPNEKNLKLCKMIDVFTEMEERYISTSEIVKSSDDVEVRRFGIPDLSIMYISTNNLEKRREYAVITDDGELYNALLCKNVPVMSTQIMNSLALHR